jgi:hypothetical protein
MEDKRRFSMLHGATYEHLSATFSEEYTLRELFSFIKAKEAEGFELDGWGDALWISDANLQVNMARRVN